MRHLKGKHAITAAVAGGCFALGVGEGGFYPTAFAIASLAVWAIVLIGLAAGLVPRADPPPAALGAGGCLLGFAALTALSVAWGSDDGAAFADTVRLLSYLGLFTVGVAIARRGSSAPWLYGLAIGLLGICLFALGSRFEPGLFGDPEGTAQLQAAAGRLSYPIGYWNGLGAAMAMCIALLVWIGARGATRVGRMLAVGALPLPLLTLYASTSRGGFVAAGIAVAALILFGPERMRLVGSLAVGCAGGAALVGFAVMRDDFLDRPGTALAETQGTEMLFLSIAVVLVTAVARWAFDRRLAELEIPPPLLSRRFLRAAGAVAAVVAVVALVAVDPVDKWESFKAPPAEAEGFTAGERDLARATSSGRYQFWSVAVDGFESDPLKGIGAGGYETWWSQHRPIELPATRAHSIVFESLGELGFPGLALVAGFFGIALFAGWRRLGLLGGPPSGEVGAALAILVAGGVSAAIDWTHDLPGVVGPAILAAALLTGPATLPRLAPRISPPVAFTRSRRRFMAGVGLLLVAWVAICASGLLLLSDRSLVAAETAVAEGRFEDAVEEANDAIDLQPWAAEPRTQLALAYEAAGDIPSAQEALAEAIERTPEDWRLWVIAIRLDVLANDIAGARIDLERAKELNPRDSRFDVPANRFFEYLAGGAATGQS
jgi:hypothetical protein